MAERASPAGPPIGTTMGTGNPIRHRVRRWLPVLGILVVALNLRAALAGYPPLLPTVRHELHLTAGEAGVVQAGAVLAMAAGSFAGARIAAVVGSERALGAAVGLVGLGCLLRGIPVAAALVGGTVLLGLGIGTAGVFLAGVARARFARHAGALTGGYVVAMMLGSMVASAVAVPVATLLGGWSLSLAVWAVPALLATAVWAATRPAPEPAAPEPRAAVRPAPEPLAAAREVGQPEPSPAEPAGEAGEPARPRRGTTRWTRLARLGACYQSGTSLIVYGWLTWLAPYYQSLGWAPGSAGLLLAVWSVAQVPAALIVPALAERRRRWRFWASLALGCAVAGTVGVLLVPLPPVLGPWLWVVLIGFGSGAGFPLGLAVIAWRTPDGAASAATSGLAMGVGYTVAGLGPLVMGLLIDATGGYPPAIGVLLAGAAAQGWAVSRIGDRCRTGDRRWVNRRWVGNRS
jgi:CP family cyanate transporter-like MFS transporter